MHKICLISIIYQEESWRETYNSIRDMESFYPVDVFYGDRKGVGSLAEVINKTFVENNCDQYEYCWIVTNVVFRKRCLDNLVKAMDLDKEYAGITPSFESDHLFCRPDNLVTGTKTIPYFEFTAPIVRSDVFKEELLDEEMPYWGHDLDWGHRVRQKGYKCGVLCSEEISHTYIRNSDQSNMITLKRHDRRRATNTPTKKQLINKYGAEWRKVLCYR